MRGQRSQLSILMAALMALILVAGCAPIAPEPASEGDSGATKDVILMLDWTPNTTTAASMRRARWAGMRRRG